MPPRAGSTASTPGRQTQTPSPSPAAETASTPPPLTSLADDVDAADSGGRISFYVQSIDEMIQACFLSGREAHLFTDDEKEALNRFHLLEYESRYLFVRLYLRKHTWIRLAAIDYESDISDLPAVCAKLYEAFLPRLDSPTPEAGPSTPSPVDPNVIDLTGEDSDEDQATTPSGPGKADDVATNFARLAFDETKLAEKSSEDLLKLLTLEELKELAKKLKVSAGGGNTKREWTKALLKTSNQSTLSFFTPPAKGKGKGKAGLGVEFDAKGNKVKQSSVVGLHALKIIGPSILLSLAWISLFDRLSLLYHRTAYTASSSSTTSLTASLLAKFGKRHYPTYKVSRSYSIFPSRQVLCEYELALAAEREIEEILSTPCHAPAVNVKDKAESSKAKFKAAEKAPEDNRKAQREVWEEGKKIYERIEGSWRKYVKEGKEEDAKEKDETKKAILYYRKRFNPGWPLTRVLYKASQIFARLDDHDTEKQIIRRILKQRVFRRGKRGAWYERLALVLMKYPSAEERDPNLSERKKCKLADARYQEALAVCLKGLSDPDTHLIYISSLQRRVKRIESAMKVDKDSRRKFDEGLKKSKEQIIIGERLDDPTTGKKSLWQGEDPAGGVSVEELALEHYTNEGWKGVHSESSVLTTIFSLCFWDVLFADVDGVFETAFQAAPLDLATDAFALVRAPKIKTRLEAIEKGKAKKILEIADDKERPRKTFCVGVNWDKFSKRDLLEIVQCIGGESLAHILRMLTEEYGHRTGGVPDLCLWNPEERRCKFVEVKGPGDHLSETQKVWIAVLLEANIEVEVLWVMTEGEKEALDDKAKERKEKAESKKRARAGSDDEEED